MNRFRAKKRAKDDLSAARTSEESEHSSLSFKGFRKGKKLQQEEVKKEFDLSNALPPEDDFRTSLLMANLSARFSMLREQDDPNTKIGKASDDSVLAPKRQSRMADFGFGGATNGLVDISEVDSVKATFLRTDSFTSDDADSGKSPSIMTRARPTEGNNLFGGRQKIYKVPAGAGSGMSGRALYDDDVALSAFQRWRLAEKEKSLGERNSMGSDEANEDTEQTRPESPAPLGYDRKRETTSTTSSASVMARNSTAATSITSQGAAGAKDGQSVSSTSTPAANPSGERAVTRTKRLYEQGFDQDVYEQVSALSRFENLARQRQTSAPNTRSASPTPAGVSSGAVDFGAKLQTESKLDIGGLPPLSPPVSETGEQPILPILPQDVGKATAMGIFQRPSHPYDESQYVQRQIQLQQGRETPTQRHRAESNATNASRSQSQEAKTAATGAFAAAQDERLPPTPAADAETTPPAVSDQAGVSIGRPPDEDHPALRQSTLPTPLAVDTTVGREPSPCLKPTISVESPLQPAAQDSPTLGPNAGLSGLVRQHLRTVSVDSSLSVSEHDAPEPKPRANLSSESRSNQWLSLDGDWTRSHGSGSQTTLRRSEEDAQTRSDISLDHKAPDRNSNAAEDDMDDFANQIALARRRVREKLTSYVESDSSRAASPLPPADSPGLSAQASSSNLGIGILKPKSSWGSLADRSRNAATGQPKGIKILGIGVGTNSTPPQSAKQSLDEKERPALETMKEEVSRKDTPRKNHVVSEAETLNQSTPARDADDDSNTHPGLRAFRQARRELQNRKELEALARQQIAQTLGSSDQPPSEASVAQPSVRNDRIPGHKSPGREGPSGERDRSGSDSSGNGCSNSQPPRLGTNTSAAPLPAPHDQFGPPTSRQPAMRSPGLPGTDIKGSPIMPPQPYPGRGAPSPAASPHVDRSRSATNLALHTGRSSLAPHSGQPSPISPVGSQGPTTAMPHQSTQQHGQSHFPPHPQHPPPMVPNMSNGSHSQGGTRSRSNSNTAEVPPPVPPINPRRRRDSRARPTLDESSTAGPRPPFSGLVKNAAGLDREDNRGGRPFPVKSRENSPPFVTNGTPGGRTMATSNGGSSSGRGVAGGMI